MSVDLKPGPLAPGRAGIMRAMGPAAATAPIRPRLAVCWGEFCLLMLLVGLQERWYAGQALWPRPLFYEGSSMLVVSVIAVWRWRRSPRDDPWLDRPAHWFWRMLRCRSRGAPQFHGAPQRWHPAGLQRGVARGLATGAPGSSP